MNLSCIIFFNHIRCIDLIGHSLSSVVGFSILTSLYLMFLIICPIMLEYPSRKVRTLYGSFLKNLELGQKFKKLNPFTDVIFRFQSTCHYNWRGQHICQRGDIPS